jgi:putative DNA primase/helicase
MGAKMVENLDKEDVIKYYKFLRHEGITELRPIKPLWSNPKKELPPSFFVRNVDEFVSLVEKYNGTHNIYAGLNERICEGKNDADVHFITNIGHDIDAHGDSSLKSIAGQIALDIRKDCLELGFKEPLILDSGRGFWVIHHTPPIENTEENVKKIKEFGKRIKTKYEREGVELDSVVYNPSRISKVAGTINVSDRENFVKSSLMNYPALEDDEKLREEILKIELPIYKPNPFTNPTPSICSFMDYCLTHELPKGERHKTISRNIAIYISDHPDRELLKEQYVKIQKGSGKELDGWLKSIDEKGKDAFPFSIGELVNFTKKYKIPFDWKSTPEYKNWKQLQKSEELIKKEIEKENIIEEFQIKSVSSDEKGKRDCLCQEVITNLALKKRSHATELIVDYIKARNYIYTTKNDVRNEMWIYRDGIYRPHGKSCVSEICREILGEVFTINFANDVVNKIEMDTFIEMEDFFQNKYIDEVPVLNGLLNLKTKELSPFDPKKIFFNKIQAKYNPLAKCPTITKHFLDVLKNENDVKVMFEIFGFLLYKDYFIEKAIMFMGDGRNGKGKTIDLMKRFLGADNCCSVSLKALEEGGFRIWDLFGKMGNLAGDLSSTSLKDTSTLKQTTGRDLIGADRKNLSTINFVNYAKHIFACNELPRVYDFSRGFWERWILFEFPYTFVKKEVFEGLGEEEKKKYRIMNPFIVETLTTEEELSGLLNEAIEGLHRILKQKDFSYSVGVNEVKRFWVRKSDSFTAFAMDSLIEEPNSVISKDEMRKKFHKYCKKFNLRGASDKNIKVVLEEMFGVTETNWNEGVLERAWKGIKFRGVFD